MGIINRFPGGGSGTGKTSIVNAVVTLGASLTYTGSVQTQTITSVVLNGVTLTENEDYTVSGNTATNAGAHSITLEGINNFEGTKTVPWTMAKAAGSVSLNPSSLTLGASGLTGTIAVTRSGDGAISVSGYNSAVISVSVSGTTVNVTCLSQVAANTTITVSVAESANYLAASTTCAVTIQYLPEQDTLENTSWADINLVAAAGLASDYWNVGDTKTIAFSSAVLGSVSVVVKILGFDYDDLAYGSGKAKISFGMVDSFAQRQTGEGTSVNGWGGCSLRNNVLIQTILPALKAVIGNNIIKPVTKYTTAGNGSTTITTTTDEVWLLSEYEIFGASSYAFGGEKPPDISICYPAFTNASSRIKKVSGSNSTWWERSPRSDNNDGFALVSSQGTPSGYWGCGSGNTLGVSVGFCI